METVLRGTKSVVHIAPHKPTVLIGKRISPARQRPIGADAEGFGAEGSGMEYVEIAKNEVLTQVAAGADVVDVDISVPDSEQATLLPRTVETVQQIVEVPLSINAPNPEALAATLQIYQGKPLVNAVSGEEESLSQILPLVAEHEAAVIGLCMDERGIPGDAQGRLEIAHKIVERAETMGIPPGDVLIDCLTSAIEFDYQAALVTLETIRLVKTNLGVNITLNVGDIASELPNSLALHQAFLTAAIVEGVNAPIANASQARQTILATDVLLGQDERTMRYIRYYHYRRSGIRSLVDWELIG